MLSEYEANPLVNWKSKDCAIYLVLALTVRGRTGECAHREVTCIRDVERKIASASFSPEIAHKVGTCSLYVVF